MSEMPLFDRVPPDPPPGEVGPTPPAGDDARDGSPEVLRVAELNRAANALVSGRWSDVRVVGELSNVRRVATGHVYFALNDEQEQAQLSGVMFRSDAARARARLQDGARVEMRGRVAIYEPRGRFQLIARQATPQGAGELAALIAQWRRELEAEGLLDPARKRPLPLWPAVVGVVTSATGAAVRDIIRVTHDRCGVRLVIADCRVQGEAAPESIARALEAIQRVEGVEVVIVARGGGSAEDLGAFHDPRVTHAIARCRVPVISGVGHETDTTLADLVADVRAATPSNAAEIAVPDAAVLEDRLDGLRRDLMGAMEGVIDRGRLRIERAERALQDPRRGVLGVRRRLAELDTALVRSSGRRLSGHRAMLSALVERLRRHDPRTALARDRRRLRELSARLVRTEAQLVALAAFSSPHSAMAMPTRSR